MRLVLRVVLAGVMCGLVLGGASASAEVGFGPPVRAQVPRNSRLTAVLHTVVVTDDPTAAIDATITAKVLAAGQQLATLGPFPVHASGIAQRVDMALPADAVAALRRIERDQRHAGGVVSYAVTVPDGDPAGPPTRTYTMSSRVSLHRPVHARRPTRMLVENGIFGGSGGQLATGWVSLAAPQAWPRTSIDGRPLATYGPIPVGRGCGAYLVAHPVQVAVRDPTSYVNGVGGRGNTVRPGHLYRVRATGRDEPVPSAAAVGLLRVALHRYAGARIDVTFDPECPPASGRATRLVDALATAVRGVAVHLQST
ncbi:MAG: hypothetical protein JWO74_3813 [Solirubrobacterales bacterium]|nr:hypothetical protein [Solirubrobacterales bacterium]